MPSPASRTRETTAADLISAREAGRRLGISGYQILKLVAAGRLAPVVELGRAPRYRSADVDRLARERGATAQAAG